jgi:carnitine monooxygenase subunit
MALRDLRLELARKVVEYAKTGTTALAPSVMQEEVSFYLDEDRYEQEHREFFRETPVVACLSTDLPQPGNYRLFDELGIPIIVWRGKDHVVRAFLNVCAHRGARLAREACGKASRLTCRFHGWTYDTTGKAVAVPEERYFDGDIASQKHLQSIPAEERHGLIFVKATPNSTMNLDAHLGAFGRELEVLDLCRVTKVVEDEVQAPSNWKYTLDTYFENYHLPVLHRDSFAGIFMHDLALFETWGPHHRFTFAHANIRDWMNKPEAEWPIDVAVPITYFLFPNVSIAVGSASPTGGLISIHRLFPRSVGELSTKIAIYAPSGPQSPEQLAEIERNFAALKKGVKDEDYSVTGESYGGLSALPGRTRFPIGRQEIGVQNFHRNVCSLLNTQSSEERQS